jgi:hypothetical protein
VGQVFPPGANWLVKWSLVGGVTTVILVVGVASALYWSPVVTRVNVVKEQPIPFSHQRHVQGNGLDCRYCHTNVETGNFAGIPATETCMTCHSQILTDQEMFQPLHDSWNTGKSIEWVRLNDLPDFVYFDHSIHINKGIGCNHCHSNKTHKIEEMRLTAKAQRFNMSWCLDCHKDPAKFIRPKSEVFNMAWNIRDAKSDTVKQIHNHGFENQKDLGEQLVKDYNVEVEQLTNCSICHR